MEVDTKSRLAKLTMATFACALVFGGVAAAVAKAESGRNEAAAVQALDAAALSLGDAIRAAEAAGHGLVTGAEFEVNGGAPYFDVTTEAGGTEIDHRIDPMTGAILASTPDAEAPGSDGDSDADEVEERAALQAVKVSLLQAIASAEAQGGKALAAEYEQEDGALAIEIEVADESGKIGEVMVDAQTGQVLAADIDSDENEDEESEEQKG